MVEDTMEEYEKIQDDVELQREEEWGVMCR